MELPRVTTTGSIPEEMKESLERDRIYKEKVLQQHQADIDLLLSSGNPEIQALCRILGLVKQRSS